METKSNLNDATIEELKDLMTANVNSAKIFREAAERTDKGHLQTLFNEIATSRESNASELQNALSVSGEFHEQESSLAAPLRSWWMKVRDTIQSDEEVGLLSALESSEDQILHAYEKSLKETAGSPLNAQLHEQVANIKKGHDRVRDLRDAAKERS